MLTSYYYGYVTVQIAVTDPVLLQAIRGTLYHLGCREVTYTASLQELEQTLGDRSCDLVFVQADIAPIKSVCGFLRSVRQGDIGNNPFLPLVSVTRTATPDQVKALAAVGIDDLLPYPWAENYIDVRLENLIHNRKPFVITSDYIGPDRRGKPRAGDTASAALSREVPNPLKAKALERMSKETLATLVREHHTLLSTDRVARLAELVVRLCGELTALHRAGQTESHMTQVCLEKLEAATRSILRRAAGTRYEPSMTSCNTLARTSGVMLQSILARTEPELHLLGPIAERFARDFGVDLRLFSAPLTQGVLDARVAASREQNRAS